MNTSDTKPAGIDGVTGEMTPEQRISLLYKFGGTSEWSKGYNAALDAALAAISSLQPSEPVAWECYWPGAGSVDSQTVLTRFRSKMEQCQKDGAQITPLVYAAPPTLSTSGKGAEVPVPPTIRMTEMPNWQLSAFDETLKLAKDRGMVGKGDLSYVHLADMRARITPDFSKAKLGRWLGWAQCAVVAAECASLDEMKEINRLASEAEIPARYRIEHDGFIGTQIGEYERLDGKRGVVLQFDGTDMVHVYGEKWLVPV